MKPKIMGFGGILKYDWQKFSLLWGGIWRAILEQGL